MSAYHYTFNKRSRKEEGKQNVVQNGSGWAPTHELRDPAVE